MFRHRQTKEQWEESWRKKINEMPDILLEKLVVNNIVKHVRLKDKKTLEVGSGSGYASFLLKKQGATVSLLDYSKTSFDVAERFFGCRDGFFLGDCFDMPFKWTNKFDLVFSVGLLEHYDKKDQIKIVREMTRVCKPGGYFLVGVGRK